MAECEDTKRKTALSWGLLSAGILLFAWGFFCIYGQSIWAEGSPRPRSYLVKAGEEHLIPWYIQTGDRTAGYFNVSGGNDKIRFYIRNPSGIIFLDDGPVESPRNCTFTAEDSGDYVFIFENLDNATDQTIYVNIQSPHGLRATSNYREGYLTILVSTLIIFFGLSNLWSAYYGKDIKPLKSELQDPAEFDFPEIFISWIGKDGKILRYWMRCILFGMILYIVGGISAVVSNTLIPDTARNLNKGYYHDVYFLTLLIVTGLTSLFAIRALRGLHGKLVYTYQHLNDNSNIGSKETDQSIETAAKKLDELMDEIRTSNTWLKEDRTLMRAFWYYLSLAGFSAIGFIVGWLTVRANSDSWIGLYTASSIVFIGCCTWIGLTVGALVFISLRGIAFLGRYYRKHVLPVEISAYAPDRLIGLKKIGEFAVDLDLAAAIPSVAFFVSYLSGTQILGSVSLICLSTYTIILVVILFGPLIPFHVKMASEKENALMVVSQDFRKVCSELSPKDPQYASRLNDIYDLHERIVKKPVWPLDRWTDPKLVATIPLPVLLSLLSNLLSKLMGLI